MRQCRWTEYLENYDFSLHYHPGKANVVVDALIRKSRGVLASIASREWQMIETVGTIVYRLALPSSLSGVDVVFHVSMLRKYTPDPTHVVDWGELIIDTNGTFKEGPVCIMDSWDQVFRHKTVKLMKVLW